MENITKMSKSIALLILSQKENSLNGAFSEIMKYSELLRVSNLPWNGP